MSQREVGAAIGVHLATVNKLESGKMSLSADRLMALATLFAVPLTEFSDPENATPLTPADTAPFLYQQISKRLAVLGYTERQASLLASDAPDMIRYIKTRGTMPSALALLSLSRVLRTDMHWLIDEEYVATGATADR